LDVRASSRSVEPLQRPSVLETPARCSCGRPPVHPSPAAERCWRSGAGRLELRSRLAHFTSVTCASSPATPFGCVHRIRPHPHRVMCNRAGTYRGGNVTIARKTTVEGTLDGGTSFFAEARPSHRSSPECRFFARDSNRETAPSGTRGVSSAHRRVTYRHCPVGIGDCPGPAEESTSIGRGSWRVARATRHPEVGCPGAEPTPSRRRGPKTFLHRSASETRGGSQRTPLGRAGSPCVKTLPSATTARRFTAPDRTSPSEPSGMHCRAVCSRIRVNARSARSREAERARQGSPLPPNVVTGSLVERSRTEGARIRAWKVRGRGDLTWTVGSYAPP
jgi:hypothetical protein